jgi:hypothetical protein
MTYSSFLSRFGPVATLIAIRAAAHEPPAPRWTRAQADPWFGADPAHETRFAYVPAVAW